MTHLTRMIAPSGLTGLGLIILQAALANAAALPVSPSGPARQSCERLTGLRLPDIEITASTWSGGGAHESTAPTVAGRSIVSLPPLCIVEALGRPTGDSRIGIEIWLPAETWNGKYLQTGNGGWAGAIHRRPMADAVRRGYAAAATDGGHQTGITDDGEGHRSAAFAIGHPEKLIDFGYRALGVTEAAAREVIEAYYGQAAERSYFVGCSGGGREALMVAQRFPEAFDGVLAGNPANDWSHWAAGLVWNRQAQLAGSAGAIPIEKRALIRGSVLATCDALDGVEDGLISDPPSCVFDPASLACEDADGSHCLTGPQIATLRKIYRGPTNAATGEPIYPGFPPGAESAEGSMLIQPSRPADFSYGDSYFGQALFEQASWDFRTLDFDKDIALSDRKGSPVVDAINPDLRTFRARGGKLIQYHGWSDPLIPAGGSIAYYEAVASFVNTYPDPGRDAPAGVGSFYRLFMIPGMGHCHGGDGPTSIVATDTSGPDDPKHDLIRALELWVEHGIAPEVFIGSGRDPLRPARTMTRPICRYPEIAHYKGTGDTNDAASFECGHLPADHNEALD